MDEKEKRIAELKREVEYNKILVEVNKSHYKRIVNLSNKLNKKLKVSEIAYSLLETLNEILSYDIGYLLRVDYDKNGEIKILENFYRIVNTENEEIRVYKNSDFQEKEIGIIKEAVTKRKYVIENSCTKGMKSKIVIPLVYDEMVSFMVILGNYQEINFSDEEAGVAVSLAGQAIIAIENARLFEEIDKKNIYLAEERAKSDRLLLNVLPQKIAEELKSVGRSKPEYFENVTVLFSDIVEFTKISTTLEAEIIINELNDIFTNFDRIAEKNNCERIKTIGDAYLCVCGIPEKNEKHAENIIETAIEMTDYIAERNIKSLYKWPIRIGIHSGSAVGGIVGTKKYIYDVFGDTINTASRMESISLPMKINISDSTFALIAGKYNVEDRGEIEIKGKGKIRAYFVNG